MSEIVIENLYKSFDTKDGTVEALKNVNLSIESGDIYGIIGMSGAGKSTLVRCINFLEVPTKGRVLINGKSLGDYTSRELRKQREDIGMIFQHFNLLMQKNVLENVCFPLYIQGKSKKDARKRAKELLDIVGLGDRTGAFPAQLSGGQKQRLAIARAIAKKAKVLVFDDSFSALDMKTDAALRKELNEKVQDASIVIVAQRVSTILHADQILVLDDGKIVGKGTHEELLKNCEVYLQIAKSQLSEKELGLEKLGLAEEKAEKETNKKEILSTKIDEKENNKLKKKSDDRKLKHKKGGK